MIEHIALLIGYAVMVAGGIVIVAALLTCCAFLSNAATHKLLDAYGGWEVFLKFRVWYHDQK